MHYPSIADTMFKYRISLWNELLPKIHNITSQESQTTNIEVTGMHLTTGKLYNLNHVTVKQLSFNLVESNKLYNIYLFFSCNFLKLLLLNINTYIKINIKHTTRSLLKE